MSIEETDAKLEKSGLDETRAESQSTEKIRAEKSNAEKTAAEQPNTEAILVSRSRSLNLGGVVMLCLLAGMVVGLLWGIFKGVSGFAALIIGGLYGVVFIGGALALIAVFVDWVLEKRAK